MFNSCKYDYKYLVTHCRQPDEKDIKKQVSCSRIENIEGHKFGVFSRHENKIYDKYRSYATVFIIN